MRIGIFPVTCLRNLQTSLCNANTGLGPIHTERQRKGKRSKNKRNISKKKIKRQRKFLLSRSLSFRVNGPSVEWLCRWDNRVKFVHCRGLKMRNDIFAITGAMSIGSTLKWCWKTGGDGTVHYWRFSLCQGRLFSSETHHFWSLGFHGFFVVNYGYSKSTCRIYRNHLRILKRVVFRECSEKSGIVNDGFHCTTKDITNFLLTVCEYTDHWRENNPV